MTDNTPPKMRYLTQEELDSIDRTINYMKAGNYYSHTIAGVLVAAKIEALEKRVAGFGEDMSKLQDTFARIATALERSNDIRERELGPVKDRTRIKGLGKS